MQITSLDHLTVDNARLLRERFELKDKFRFDPDISIFRRCTVRLLLVTDGLSFSPTDDFGLGTFVKVLLDSNIAGRVRITLANIGAFNTFHTDPSLTSEGRIHARIANFRFDAANQFNPADFDAVFLFGITSTYSSSIRSGGQLDDSEIAVLNAFQNGGGGVFATGDHGSLGRALCSKVARARDMRFWTSTTNSNLTDEVSMTGPRRNDTNVSNAGSNLFDDQSDDIPQTVSPRFYTATSAIFRYRFPHPLLCGPNGVIRVMPDHPHEGECKLPGSLTQQIVVNGANQPEYPASTTGGAQPVPEIVSWNHVAAGRTSSGKSATPAQTFPGICAYDGHRAGIGRVVTDATWHHFVNTNLVGIDGVNSGPHALGFLGSAAGQAAFENIKAYYRNLMLWLSRTGTISCLRSTFILQLVYSDRVLEAVLTAREIGLERISPHVLSIIGRHARDALGRYASRCQSLELIIDLILPEWRVFVDPWDPVIRPGADRKLPERLEVFDFESMLEAALGGALVLVANQFEDQEPEAVAKIDADRLLGIARKGAETALQMTGRDLKQQFEEAQSLLAERGIL